MMAADLVSLAAFASIPVAAALGCLTVAQLLVAALLGGSAKVFFATAYKAFMPALLPAGDLLEGGNAKLQGSEQVSQVAGPGAAGPDRPGRHRGGRGDRGRGQLRGLRGLPVPDPGGRTAAEHAPAAAAPGNRGGPGHRGPRPTAAHEHAVRVPVRTSR